MNEHVVDSPPVFTYFNGTHQESVAHQTLVVVFPEEHFFAVAQMYRAFGADLAVGYEVMDAVVENHAVLEDFDHRCAFVAGGGHHHFLRCGEFYVDCACEEVAACAEHEFCRDEGVFSSAVGR